jgi:hypothetical protein
MPEWIWFVLVAVGAVVLYRMFANQQARPQQAQQNQGPLTFGVGQSAVLRAPMAAAIIGGLFTSTALTIVVIPCLYHLLARFDRLAADRYR